MATAKRRRRSKARPLPKRTLPEVVRALPTLRQSLLAEADNCLLTTRFGLEGYSYTNAAQARGIIFHRYAAEVLRTLWRTGEETIPVAEALEVLYEVAGQRDAAPEDLVVVPMRERRLLRIAAIKFVYDTRRREPRAFRMQKLLDVETRLFAPVRYRSPDWHDCDGCLDAHGAPSGRVPREDTGELVACPKCAGEVLVPGEGWVTRLLTGQPDALLADPPNGAVVPDWKTTPQAPPEHVEEVPHGDDAATNVSYMGFFQQRFYALLVMRNYPSVERVTLREFYVLPGEVRKATLYRDDLEHVEREFAAVAEVLDRAVMGGARSRAWQPSPGLHCGYCPKPMSCPIEPEARITAGGVTSQAQAERAAAEAAVAKEAYGKLRGSLKNWYDATGLPVPVKSAKGRYEWRWGHDSGGRRRFDLHVPDRSDRGPKDPNLEAAFEGAAERRRAA